MDAITEELKPSSALGGIDTKNLPRDLAYLQVLRQAEIERLKELTFGQRPNEIPRVGDRVSVKKREKRLRLRRRQNYVLEQQRLLEYGAKPDVWGSRTRAINIPFTEQYMPRDVYTFTPRVVLK